MSQDTPYYEFIHGENGIQIPFLKNLYMQVARLVSREIETNRNFDNLPDRPPKTEDVVKQELSKDSSDPRQCPELAFDMRDILLSQLFGVDGFSNFFGQVALFEKRSPNPADSTDTYQKRIYVLVDTLTKQISVWVNSNRSAAIKEKIMEAIEETITLLKRQPFGLQIFHVVGYIYTCKAKDYLSRHSVTKKVFSRLKINRKKETEGQKNKAAAISTMNALQKTISKLELTCQKEAAAVELFPADRLRTFLKDKQDLEFEVLSKFLKVVWLGLQSEIQCVLEEVCDIVLENNPTVKSPEDEMAQGRNLEMLGTLFQQTYQRASRRRVSFFYWDVCGDMGIDIYRQDARYAKEPTKVAVKNGQRLAPDSAMFEFMHFGVGDPMNLVDFDAAIRACLEDDEGGSGDGDGGGDD